MNLKKWLDIPNEEMMYTKINSLVIIIIILENFWTLNNLISGGNKRSYCTYLNKPVSKKRT